MKNSALLQISLHISPESEEAVSELFHNLLGQPPSVYTDAETGGMTATVYLEQRQWKNSLRGQIVDGLSAIEKCGLEIASKKISVRKIRREDWAESWKRHFKPIEAGKSLLIKPSWSKRKAKKGQAVVILDPGLSFGTGQHATTSFCLRQIVKRHLQCPGFSFLDIGTGSGILAIAAAKLGCQPIEAFDFDPESVRVSRDNARLNRVETELHILQKDLCQLSLRSNAKFDLVCANLIYDLLLAEAEKIVHRVAPSGHLVLAGILRPQFAQVRSRYEQIGLKLLSTKVEKEWQSGLFSAQG